MQETSTITLTHRKLVFVFFFLFLILLFVGEKIFVLNEKEKQLHKRFDRAQKTD